MRHEVGDGAHLQTPPARKGDAGLAAEHRRFLVDGLAGDRLTVVDNLADGGGLDLAGEAAELGGGLGVSLALAHASRPRPEGEDVAGAAQARGLGGRIGEHAAGEGAVAGADARGHGVVGGVDGERVGGSARVLVGRDHLRQLERLGECRAERCADEPGRVPHHEAHLLRRQVLRRDD